MSGNEADRLKKLRADVLAAGIEDPDGDARLVLEPAKGAPPKWTKIARDADFTSPRSYLVSYRAQGTRFWHIMTPFGPAGLAEVMNSTLLMGNDVSHIRVTRLALNPAHK